MEPRQGKLVEQTGGKRGELRGVLVDGRAKRRAMQNISGSPSMADNPQMKSCLKRFSENRSTKKPSAPRVYRGASGDLLDTKSRKRVKFVERDAGRSISHQQDVSLPSTDTNHASGCRFPVLDPVSIMLLLLVFVIKKCDTGDDPRTSEFKSFKKLLEEAGRGLHSHIPVKQGKILSSSTRTGDLKNKHTCNNEVTGFVLPVEKVAPVNQLPSLLTTGALGDKAGGERTTSSTPPRQKATSSQPTLLVEEAADRVLANKPQYKNGGTFYEKRQILINSAASALSIDVNELLSIGCDLIPVFLRRLGINRKADNCDELRRMSTIYSNGRSQLLACPNVQSCLEEPYEMLGTNCRQAVARDIAENNFHGGWWNRADELSCSMEDGQAQFFPTWNMTKSVLPKNRSHSYFLLDSPYLPAKGKSDLDFSPSVEVAISRCTRPMFDNKTSTSSWVNQPSPFQVLYEEQPVLSHSNFSLLELDGLHSPNKPKQFPRQHLLGWNEEINSAEELFVASDGTEMKGPCQLPLTFYGVPRAHPVGDSGVVDNCTGGSLFHSFGDIRIAEDMIYPSLDHVLLPSRTKFAVGSEWEDLTTDYFREFFLSYNTNHHCSHISSSAFEQCPVESSGTENRSQITSMLCDLYDLSPFGFGISPEWKKMIFLPLADE